MGKILLIVGYFYHTFFTEKSKENFNFVRMEKRHGIRQEKIT